MLTIIVLDQTPCFISLSTILITHVSNLPIYQVRASFKISSFVVSPVYYFYHMCNPVTGMLTNSIVMPCFLNK